MELLQKERMTDIGHICAPETKNGRLGAKKPDYHVIIADVKGLLRDFCAPYRLRSYQTKAFVKDAERWIWDEREKFFSRMLQSDGHSL